MLNRTFLKFSIGFVTIIALSFGVLLVIIYYKIENSAIKINTASQSEELKLLSQ